MLQFNYEHCNADHFTIIKKWFEARNFPAPNPDFLPPTGIMVSHDEKNIACGSLFFTDAGIASIGHLISDKDSAKEVRQQAVDFTVATLMRIASEKGFGLITCCSNIEKLNKRFESLGFERVDENVTHFRRFTCHL